MNWYQHNIKNDFYFSFSILEFTDILSMQTRYMCAVLKYLTLINFIGKSKLYLGFSLKGYFYL